MTGVRVRAVREADPGAEDRPVSKPQRDLLRALLREREIPPEVGLQPWPANELEAKEVIDRLMTLPRLRDIRNAKIRVLRADIEALLGAKPTRAEAIRMLRRAVADLA